MAYPRTIEALQRAAGTGARGLLAAASLGAGACTGDVFACADDLACGDGGVCEPTGFCSFPDDDCGSGRRYGDHAGAGLSQQCVELDGTTSSSGTTDPTLASLDGPSTTIPTTSSASVTDGSSGAAVDSSSSTGEPSCPPGWWDCAWSHRVALTVADATFGPIGATPLMVRLTPERWDRSVAQPAAEDLRFVDDVGASVPHEIEGVGDEVIAWIRWPSPPPTHVHMYWGNPGAVDGQAPTSVWQDDHEAVWHMGDGADSTGAHPLTLTDIEPAGGMVGAAAAFDGNSSYMQGARDDSMASLFSGPATIEAWILPASAGAMGRGRIVDNAADSTPTAGWTLQVRAGGPTSSGLQFEIGQSFDEAVWLSQPVIEHAQWHHVAVVLDEGEATLYIDGAAVETSGQPGFGQPSLGNADPITIGRVAGQSNSWFDGVIDEVRLSSVARDPAWIVVQWSAARDVVLGFGAIEQRTP